MNRTVVPFGSARERRSRTTYCQVPGLVETVFSRLGGLPGELGVVVKGLALDGWDQPELAVEATVVVPVDVLGHRDFGLFVSERGVPL